MNIAFYESPIGTLKICDNGKALTEIRLVTQNTQQQTAISQLATKTKKQLAQYFSGKRKIFDLPLELSGTDFQKKVWQALREIPYGKTASYKEIAEKIGNPKACRAVGMANNKNPLLIVVPCHRVIGSDGSLVGFGCGLKNKEILLNLESSE
jgi:methylated-DNA-[protein]-cysteine S-methyltransferase